MHLVSQIRFLGASLGLTALIASATLGTSKSAAAQRLSFSTISDANTTALSIADDTVARDYQRYFNYREFASREANRAPPGWSNSVMRQARKRVATIYSFTGGSYLKLLVADRILDYAVAKAHAVYTSSTRYPIDHARVETVIDSIQNFDSQCTKENFVRAVLESYLPAKSAYFRSNSSHALIKSLISPRESVDVKIAEVLAYIKKRPTISQFSRLYQNNGKRLFNTIILVAESSTKK